MASVDINYNGLDTDLKKVLSAYPEKTLSFMQSEANKWKKDCNDKGYSNYDRVYSDSKLIKSVTTYNGGNAETKKYYKKNKKNISASWKNIKEENVLHQVTEIQVQNNHPLFHLLENGHVKWLWGKNSGGFVAGKHWAEKTRAEWKDKFKKDVDKFVNKMLKKYNL